MIHEFTMKLKNAAGEMQEVRITASFTLSIKEVQEGHFFGCPTYSARDVEYVMDSGPFGFEGPAEETRRRIDYEFHERQIPKIAEAHDWDGVEGEL